MKMIKLKDFEKFGFIAKESEGEYKSKGKYIIDSLNNKKENLH